TGGNRLYRPDRREPDRGIPVQAGAISPADQPDPQPPVTSRRAERGGGESARDRPRHPPGDLVRGRAGTGPAHAGRRASIAVELDLAAIGRLPEPVEVAAYNVVSEALTNATRHAHASVVCVAAEERGDSL